MGHTNTGIDDDGGDGCLLLGSLSNRGAKKWRTDEFYKLFICFFHMILVIR